MRFGREGAWWVHTFGDHVRDWGRRGPVTSPRPAAHYRSRTGGQPELSDGEPAVGAFRRIPHLATNA